MFRKALNELKDEFWNNTEVILHSHEIRKCVGSFSMLQDNGDKQRFYIRLNEVISAARFHVIAVAIDKFTYTNRYGDLNDVYSQSLSFILERLVYYLNDFEGNCTVKLLFEKRGNELSPIL